MKNTFKRYRLPKEKRLSATWRPGVKTSNSMNLDEALHLIETKQKASEKRSRSHKFRPTTLKDVFNIANAIAHTQASKDKIRMPVFSIQKRLDLA